MDSRRPCIKVTDETNSEIKSSPRSVLVLDHHATLPGASSAFREVMAELNPPASSSSGSSVARSPRRRKSTQTKHVHYVTEEKVTDRGETVIQIREAQHDEGRRKQAGEEEEEEEEELQILHGKCHCYFVRNGTVMGLADHQCHHEHRNHAFSHQHSPASSSATSALLGSPLSSPRLHRKAGRSSSPVPEWFSNVTSNNNNNDNNKLPPLSPASSLLPVPPQANEFRMRSHSDTAAMARIQNSKRATPLASTSTAAGYGNLDAHSPSVARRRGSSSPRGRGEDGGDDVGSNNKHHNHHGVGGLADSVSASLHLTNSPPPIIIQEATDPDLALSSSSDPRSPKPAAGPRERARRSSAHTIPSDQLHYLYDQFLHPGGAWGIPSRQRPRSANGASR